MLRRSVGVETMLPLGWEAPGWEQDVRRVFAAIGWTVGSIGPMPNTDYDWIEMHSDGRELEPATLGNLLTELGVTSGEYAFDLHGFGHEALKFVDADWWERCPDPRGLFAVVRDVAHDHQLHKAPAQIGERKGWLTILALRPFCRRERSGDVGALLRRTELDLYVDALDRTLSPDEPRFQWFRKQAPLRLGLEVVQVALEDLRESPSEQDVQRAADDASAKVTAIVRDVFGNPFRPVSFSPDWRTETVLAMARGVYERGETDAMPILADALQDVGCDDAHLLAHCRGSGPHVRGCWAVDLVLGRS